MNIKDAIAAALRRYPQLKAVIHEFAEDLLKLETDAEAVEAKYRSWAELDRAHLTLQQRAKAVGMAKKISKVFAEMLMCLIKKRMGKELF